MCNMNIFGFLTDKPFYYDNFWMASLLLTDGVRGWQLSSLICHQVLNYQANVLLMRSSIVGGINIAFVFLQNCIKTAV